jgi:hypothetical protein
VPQHPWQPYCGQEFYGPVAGKPVICDLEWHGESVMHRNSETGYQWWAFMSYPQPRPAPRADEDEAA